MQIQPLETNTEIEFDYALIDPNLNANYYYELQSEMVSLAPEYAKKTEHVFPYLLNLNRVEPELLQEIQRHDQQYGTQGSAAFFILKFKSYPTREPDIVEHLKRSSIYQDQGKKFLYRFYDPKIWMLLNYFEATDFQNKNKYFQYIQFYFLNRMHTFHLPKAKETENIIQANLLRNIGLNNRLFELLQYKVEDLERYYTMVEQSFLNIEYLKSIGLSKQDDVVAAAFHMHLLGKDYVKSNFFLDLQSHDKGYEIASKRLSSDAWEVYFKSINLTNENIINRVMYDY